MNVPQYFSLVMIQRTVRVLYFENISVYLVSHCRFAHSNGENVNKNINCVKEDEAIHEPTDHALIEGKRDGIVVVRNRT